jgi:hypothetical protein
MGRVKRLPYDIHNSFNLATYRRFFSQSLLFIDLIEKNVCYYFVDYKPNSDLINQFYLLI